MRANRAASLGRVGVSTRGFEAHPPGLCRDVVAEVDELGYGTVWVPESVGREVFTHCAVYLAATRRISVASAIANVWARSAWAARAATQTLGSAFGDRFVLGVGIGHRPLVERMGLDYGTPLEAMRAYLDAMDAAPFAATRPDRDPLRLLAAMGPKMLSLAAERCDGALPNCTTPDQTRAAREVLGDKLLAPSLKVVLSTDPSEARAAGRKALQPYWTLPNYLAHLRRSGWDDADLSGGGSNRFVDALVAWGAPDTIATRVREHLDAGADHVVLHVQPVDDRALALPEWRALAPALQGILGA